jgi:Zn-dependent peptidase ImmA (M78 family)
VLLHQHKAQVRALAARFAALHPLREPLALAQAIGASLQYGDLGDKDGAFDPSRKLVLLNQTSSPERLRFTMAHEVTHALILGDDDLLSDLHDAYAGDEFEQHLETLCNIGASEILMPREPLRQLLATYGQKAVALPRLARHFAVSRQAACVALVEQLEQQATSSIVALLRARGSASKRLEVEFAVKTEQMKYPLIPGTLIPTEHIASYALETGLPMEGKGFIPFRSGRKMPANVDAHPESGVVFVIFTIYVEC